MIHSRDFDEGTNVIENTLNKKVINHLCRDEDPG
jgi:hypothetical protein